MIQATSGTSNRDVNSPDAPSSPLKKEEPVQMANLPTTYAGLAEADRAEALAAAVSASPGRSTTAAVATVICREALNEATTAPGAALRAVAPPGADAVVSTHA